VETETKKVDAISFYESRELEEVVQGNILEGPRGGYELVTYADSRLIQTLRRSSGFQIETVSRRSDECGLFYPTRGKIKLNLSRDSRDLFIRAAYNAAVEMLKEAGI